MTPNRHTPPTHALDVGLVCGIVVPGILTDFVEEASCLISPDRERGGLEVGDSDMSYLVRDTDSIYTIEQISRGHLTGVALRTTEAKAVWLYLAFVFGPAWRNRAHLPA